MNRTPLILICGQAGSGKDTVANFMVKNHGAVAIAQADPMKRLAKLLFDFTDDQLWGPSESRNAEDKRFDPDFIAIEHVASVVGVDSQNPWDRVWSRFDHYSTLEWLTDVLNKEDVSRELKALSLWLENVMEANATDFKPLTPRFVLQTLGTEWGRAQGRDIWTDYAQRVAFKLLGGGYSYDRSYGVTEDPKTQAPNWVVITDGRFRNEIVNVLRAGGITMKVFNPQGVNTSAVDAAGVKGHQSEKELGGIPEHFYGIRLKNDKATGLKFCEVVVADLMKNLEARTSTAGEYSK